VTVTRKGNAIFGAAVFIVHILLKTAFVCGSEAEETTLLEVGVFKDEGKAPPFHTL
jgi:hypothetical protein